MKKTIKILLIIFISLICSIKDIKAEELPKLYFEGNISNMTSKSDERKIKLTYTSENLNFNAYALIKLQGASSLSYEKKNYTIKLYEDDEYTNKKKVDVGFGEESKYCLKANWVDMTHSRNIVTAKITSKIQKKYNLFTDTPNNGLIDGFPIEIYINNEFLGLYTLNIPKDEWMFNMDKDNPNHIVLSGISYTDATEFRDYATFNEWEVEIGPETEETLEKLNRVIGFVINSTDEEFKENFENYFNLDATLNYYIMLDVGELFDNTSKNMLMVTYDGEVWYPSLYDLDTSWGANWNGISLLDYNTKIIDHANNNLLWIKFERNFNNEIANRYFELRKDILTKENILNEFNKFINSIPSESLEKENNRWNDIPGYEINQIEDFLNTRLPLTDDYMYNLYDIEPTIFIDYSTTNKSILPIKITITPNRNDITLLKDGIPSNDYTYKFKENGEHTITYQDYKGTLYSTTIKIDWIIKDKILKIIIPIIPIASLIILILIYTKIKTSKEQSISISNSINTNQKNTKGRQATSKANKTNNLKNTKQKKHSTNNANPRKKSTSKTKTQTNNSTKKSSQNTSKKQTTTKKKKTSN